MDSSYIGVAFTVTKPDTWFPKDFLVCAEEGHCFRIRNADDTYLVARTRFMASLEGLQFHEAPIKRRAAR